MSLVLAAEIGPITCNRFLDTGPRGWRIEEPLVDDAVAWRHSGATHDRHVGRRIARGHVCGSLALPSRRSPTYRRRVAPRGTGARRARTAVVAATGGDDDKDGSKADDDIDWKGVFKDSVSEAKRQFMEPLNSPADYVDMMDAPRRKEQRGQKYQEEYGGARPRGAPTRSPRTDSSRSGCSRLRGRDRSAAGHRRKVLAPVVLDRSETGNRGARAAVPRRVDSEN